MRSFAAIFTALSLPLYVFAAHFGNRGDRHLDLAVRARGDVLQKREFSGPFTVYDITTGVYVPRLCFPRSLCLIISTVRLAVEHIAQTPM
jgi:hypothetical protein